VLENESLYLPFDVILSTNRNTNRNGTKKLDWMIKPKDLEAILKVMYSKDIFIKEKNLIVVDQNPFVLECEDNSKIEIVKKPHHQVSVNLKLGKKQTI